MEESQASMMFTSTNQTIFDRHQRRGSAMVLAVSTLFALFIACVVFLAVSRTETEILSVERKDFEVDRLVDGAIERLQTSLVNNVYGQEIVLRDLGIDGLCATPDDVIFSAGRLPYTIYYEDTAGLDLCSHTMDQIDTASVGFAATNPDIIYQPEIPGRHPLFSSIEPYEEPAAAGFQSVLQWYATTDLHRAWDNKADVQYIASVTDWVPTVGASRPLRIRPLDAHLFGTHGYYDYLYDQTKDDVERHGAPRDITGDGVVDGTVIGLSRAGGGEIDWFSASLTGPDGITGNDYALDCSTWLSTASGPPSFTTTTPILQTLLPCDDRDGSLYLEEGLDFPRVWRQALVEDLDDPIDSQNNDQDFDNTNAELHLGMRLEINNGRANLNHSHPSILDNLLGYDSSGALVVRSALVNGPYGIAEENWLRRRGILPSAALPADSALAQDVAQLPLGADLYSMLVDPMISSVVPNPLVWYPLEDGPDHTAPFDNEFEQDWRSWMNPRLWADKSSGAVLEYDIRHLLTTVSRDDLLITNGLHNDGGTVRVLLNNLDGVFPTSLFGDTGVDMYPGYDPTGFDLSFQSVTTGPKVPLALFDDGTGLRVPRDSAGKADFRFGNVKFSLQSFGDINNVTPREQETLAGYFAMMLRNVTNTSALGGDNIYDLASQLAANVIDRADYDYGGDVNFNATFGGKWDLPTIVTSPTGKRYAGIEKQPFITEVSTDFPVTVEIHYPHLMDAGDVDFSEVESGLLGLRVIDDTGLINNGPVATITSGIIAAATPYLTFDEVGGGGGLLSDPSVLTGLDQDWIVQLVQIGDPLFPGLPAGDIIVLDEFRIPTMNLGGQSHQRDTNSDGGWLTPVAVSIEANSTFGMANAGVDINARPVHATPDNFGSIAAFPTTGSLLLTMRWANPVVQESMITSDLPLSMRLASDISNIENGHMPVFDMGAIAQNHVNNEKDQVVEYSIPWGQLIFNYFTALPLVDPLLTGDRDVLFDSPMPVVPDLLLLADYENYIIANQPPVKDGFIVEGQININAAPWKVIQGVPYYPPGTLPMYRDMLEVSQTWPGNWDSAGFSSLQDPAGAPGVLIPMEMGEPSLTPGPVLPFEQFGAFRARSVVAYREQRVETTFPAVSWSTGSYNTLGGGSRLRNDGDVDFYSNTNQRHMSGFLTVGELANVRNDGAVIFGWTAGRFRMDNGQLGSSKQYSEQNYLVAIAPLVAMGDWFTTKGNVFTAYGVVRGNGDKNDVDDKAIRFQLNAIDRTNIFYEPDNPSLRPNIGSKIQEPLYQISPN